MSDTPITPTALRKKGEVQIFFDKFPGGNLKFGYTANPLTFTRRALFGTDSGEPTLILTPDEARKLAEEILSVC